MIKVEPLDEIPNEKNIIPEQNIVKKWSENSVQEKTIRIFFIIVKILILLTCLYFFIVSLDLMSSSFRLIAGRSASELFKSPVLSNPLAGLMIGVFVTVLVQSSSTSTSIVVSMMAAEIIPEVRIAIPIVMGANIGTSVTTILVSLTHMGNKERFKRSFSGATVHDMFNLLTVLVLLPLEIATGYLESVSDQILNAILSHNTEVSNPELLTALTKPLTHLIVELDMQVLAINSNETIKLIKRNCTDYFGNRTYCESLLGKLEWPEWTIGLLLLIISLAVLCLCLIALVKVLNSIFKGTFARITQRIVNFNLPGIGKHFTGYLFIFIGCGMTILVQSSSVFISTLIPLIALGTVEIERIFPLCLGSNIGTTVTGLMAALSSNSTKKSFKLSLQIALSHTLFNLTGILVWYPIPFMRKIPINLAKMLGGISAEYRWFGIFYLVNVFLLIPLVVFGISLAGNILFLCIIVPLICLTTFVIVINIIQRKKPKILPKYFQTWEFLPLAMRSLKPYDNFFNKYICWCKCLQKAELTETEDQIKIESIQNEKHITIVEKEFTRL